jgi:hypothetical protein
MDLTDAITWHKARKSGNNGGDCVEIGTHRDSTNVLIRDTKARERGHLSVTRAAFAQFLRELADGRTEMLRATTPSDPRQVTARRGFPGL